MRKNRQNSFNPYEEETIEVKKNQKDDEFNPYGDEDLTKSNNPKRHDTGKTAEDTEAYLAKNGNKRDQNRNEDNKVSPEKDSFANIQQLNDELDTPDTRVFEALDRSELPMTAKIDSILSRELKNVTLDEDHFILPVPEPSNPHGIKVTVYLFGTKESVNIDISSKYKVTDVIRHLLTITKSEPKEPMAYELRLIDDDEDFYVPFYEISALERNDSVGEFKTLALVRNKNYEAPKPASIEDLQSLRETKWKTGDIFTIYVKLPFLEAKVNMEMDTKKTTLHDLLKRINKKYEVDMRETMYCFKVHSETTEEITDKNIEDIVYNNNMLDNRLLLKNLQTKELDLVNKVYGDSIVGNSEVSHEEKITRFSMISDIGLQQNLMSHSNRVTGANSFADNSNPAFVPYDSVIENSESFSPQKAQDLKRRETVKEVKDFLFNEVTAKKLHEYEVTKINSKGKRQKRIFGIDGYAVYNDKDPNRKKGKNYMWLKKMFKPSEVKRSTRPLNTITNIERKDDISFEIQFNDSKLNFVMIRLQVEQEG